MSNELLYLLAGLWCLIIYHHLVYPIILLKIVKRSSDKNNEAKNNEAKNNEAKNNENATLIHSISIIVPVFNEADVIADKIRNVASLDYPSHQLKLIIACDGCSDNSASIARQTAQEFENKQLDIEIIEFSNNRGKVAILNQIIPKMKSDIIALSDASALISIDGLLIANQHFNVPSIGVVAATYQLLNPGSQGEKKYWDYQVEIKKGEAALGSPIGVHGALYFFRRTLFTPLSPQVINDDFILPMKIIAQGYKGVYADDLIALELEQSNLVMDQKRRTRIAAGNLQQLFHLTNLLLPSHGGTAFNFLSGKALRALMPLMLLIQLLICIYLSQASDLFLLITAMQIFGITLSRASLLITTKVDKSAEENSALKWFKPVLLIFYLINGYISGLIGSLRYLLGLERGCWKSVSKEDKTL